MSAFFGQVAELIVSDLKFIHPEIDIEFVSEFDEDKEPNTTTINIFNVSKDNVAKFKRGEVVTLKAGYSSDFGTVLAGVAYDVYTDRVSTDNKTVIKAYDITDQYINLQVSKSYKAGFTTSLIIKDILSLFGLTSGRIELSKDVSYNNGFTAQGRLQSVLERLASDAQSRLVIKNGTIHFLNTASNLTTAFVLNSGSGLLDVQKIDKENSNAEWKVTMVFNHEIHVRSLLVVESNKLNATCLVVRGEHNCKIGNVWITECEVITVNE